MNGHTSALTGRLGRSDRGDADTSLERELPKNGPCRRQVRWIAEWPWPSASAPPSPGRRCCCPHRRRLCRPPRAARGTSLARRSMDAGSKQLSTAPHDSRLPCPAFEGLVGRVVPGAHAAPTRWGMAELRKKACGSTKIKANAKHLKARAHGRMQRSTYGGTRIRTNAPERGRTMKNGSRSCHSHHHRRRLLA